MMILEKYTRDELVEALRRPALPAEKTQQRVREIFDDIRTGGDDAAMKWTRRFDSEELSGFRVANERITASGNKLQPSLKEAIKTAAFNIEKFHAAQKVSPPVTETSPGVSCWQKVVPVDRVGLYIPGGTAPLFSTLLMLAIPARTAGCKRIIACTPPRPDGSIDNAVLYSALVSGVTDLFALGGIQAIASMTLGTESVPAVDKIFGPGNQYVTAAKQRAALMGVAIDLPAGPSEVMVVADKTTEPAFAAADLLSQAEHGPDSQVVLIADSSQTAGAIIKETGKQVALLPRRDIATGVLENAVALVEPSAEETIDIINMYAPEHLILSVKEPGSLADRVRNAGSVFIGKWCPESAGDYASGTNHTLPTNGAARAWSGVTLSSFTKTITYQSITRNGLQQLAPVIIELAEAEGLQAHANAVRIRTGIK